MNTDSRQQHAMLQQIARRVMAQRGLFTESSREAIAELERIQVPPARTDVTARDLRNLPWASIDNDDSLDLTSLPSPRCSRTTWSRSWLQSRMWMVL